MSFGGGGGGHQTTVSSSQPQINKMLRPLMQQSSTDWLTAMQQAGQNSLASLLAANPEQIAQLTPSETSDIGQLQQYATSGTPQMNQAQALINSLTSGALGSSPETLAGMAAYNQNIMPTITSSLGATGGGRGGALTAALTQGQTSAYMPLIQQEIQNRESAIGQESDLANMQSQNVQNALNANDMVRQIQQSQLSSNFQDFLRRSGLIQQLVQGPLSNWGGNTFGSQSVSQGTTESAGGGLF